jgi:hypothetical protein
MSRSPTSSHLSCSSAGVRLTRYRADTALAAGTYLGPARLPPRSRVRCAAARAATAALVSDRAGGPCRHPHEAELPARRGIRVLGHGLRCRRDPDGAGDGPASPRDLPPTHLDPVRMDATWLEGHESDRVPEVAHHYSDDLDLTTISPTIDWAGGGLATTARDLSRFVRALWRARILESRELHGLTAWTPGASFPKGHAVRYEQYGLGTGRTIVERGRAHRPHRVHWRVRVPRAAVRRRAGRYPQRVTGRPLAAGGQPLPRATGGIRRLTTVAPHPGAEKAPPAGLSYSAIRTFAGPRRRAAALRRAGADRLAAANALQANQRAKPRCSARGPPMVSLPVRMAAPSSARPR